MKAQIPVIILEQVTECRDILEYDYVSQRQKTSPQERVVATLQEGGYHVIEGDDGLHGQVINSADFGGVVNRNRLITIACRTDLWERQGTKFKWPEAGLVPARPVFSILDKIPKPEYVERQ